MNADEIQGALRILNKILWKFNTKRDRDYYLAEATDATNGRFVFDGNFVMYIDSKKKLHKINNP